MVETRPGLAFGPILYAMHTLSRGTLKLTAQMPPLGKKEAGSVRLDAKDGSGKWRKQAVAPIDPLSRTATFWVKDWKDSRDVPYHCLEQEGRMVRPRTVFRGDPRIGRQGGCGGRVYQQQGYGFPNSSWSSTWGS